MNAHACPFCDHVRAGRIRVDGQQAVAIADSNPLNPGHTLIIPRRHESDFFALNDIEQEAMLRLARKVHADLDAQHHPDGFNLGVNVGAAAGQTVDHVHLHVIPRYRGDVAEPRGGVRWIIPARAPYWR